jgi:hypothetical protein
MKAIATVSMYDMGAANRNALNHSLTLEQRKEIIKEAAEQRYVEFTDGEAKYTSGTVQEKDFACYKHRRPSLVAGCDLMAVFRFTRSRENRFLIAGGPCEFDPAIIFMNRDDFETNCRRERKLLSGLRGSSPRVLALRGSCFALGSDSRCYCVAISTYRKNWSIK